MARPASWSASASSLYGRPRPVAVDDAVGVGRRQPAQGLRLSRRICSGCATQHRQAERIRGAPLEPVRLPSDGVEREGLVCHGAVGMGLRPAASRTSTTCPAIRFWWRQQLAGREDMVCSNTTCPRRASMSRILAWIRPAARSNVPSTRDARRAVSGQMRTTLRRARLAAAAASTPGPRMTLVVSSPAPSRSMNSSSAGSLSALEELASSRVRAGGWRSGRLADLDGLWVGKRATNLLTLAAHRVRALEEG